MELLVLCEHCKKYYKIKSRNQGYSVNDSNIDVNFEIEWTVNNTDELEEMTEISEDDVEVTDLKAKFSCPNCGEFIQIET